MTHLTILSTEDSEPLDLEAPQEHAVVEQTILRIDQLIQQIEGWESGQQKRQLKTYLALPVIALALLTPAALIAAFLMEPTELRESNLKQSNPSCFTFNYGDPVCDSKALDACPTVCKEYDNLVLQIQGWEICAIVAAGIGAVMTPLFSSMFIDCLNKKALSLYEMIQEHLPNFPWSSSFSKAKAALLALKFQIMPARYENRLLHLGIDPLEDPILQDLICPITRELPSDPIKLQSGHVYSTTALQVWVATQLTPPTAPDTLQKLTAQDLKFKATPEVTVAIEARLAALEKLHAEQKSLSDTQATPSDALSWRDWGQRLFQQVSRGKAEAEATLGQPLLAS